jgi:hypothetical protein
MESELTKMIDFYQQNKTQVHIEILSGKYYNGLILENSEKHIIILDRVIGEVFLLLSEIKIIEKFMGRGEKRNDTNTT